MIRNYFLILLGDYYMSTQPIFLTLLLSVSYCVVSFPTGNASTDTNPTIAFQYEEIKKGVNECIMFQEGTDDMEAIGTTCIIQAEHFAQFVSPEFDAIDLNTIDLANSDPKVVFSLVLTRAIKSKYNLYEAVVLADLYISPEYRGKGFAQQLINKVCQDAFQKGTKIIVVNPYPFELENEERKLLLDAPDYAEKQQQLIILFQRCGFIADVNNPTLFMYRSA